MGAHIVHETVPLKRHYTTVEAKVGAPEPYLAGPVQKTIHYGTEHRVTGHSSVIHKPQIHAPRIGVPTTLLNRVYHNPAEVSVDSYNVHVKKPVPNPVPVEVEVLGEPIVKHVEVEGAPIVEHKYAAPVYTHSEVTHNTYAAAPHHAIVAAPHHGYAALPAVPALPHAGYAALPALQPHHTITAAAEEH